MTSAPLHELRSRWHVSYLPLLTPDVVTSEYKGDWERATRARVEKLDWITTVEELWSTVNSLPKIQHLGVGSSYIFARDDKDPSFENFPRGSRVVVSMLRSPALELGLEVVLAAVLGEIITEEVSDGAPVCDVVRVIARTSREYVDVLRVEVWLNDKTYSTDVAAYIRRLFGERNFTPASYTISENAFTDAPASPKPTQTSTASTSSTSANLAASVCSTKAE